MAVVFGLLQITFRKYLEARLMSVTSETEIDTLP